MKEEDQNAAKPGLSLEWLLRGTLTRLGDIFDSFTRRKEVPPSSLATSQLVERLKRLLDSKVKLLPEKGKVVPHNIRLRIQWDKFATDQNDTAERLQKELLAAAVDHINDSQYYTLGPIDLQVTPDYFTDGVKLLASFDTFEAGESDETNITVPAANITNLQPAEPVEAEPAMPILECSIHSREMRSPLRLRVPNERRITVGRAGGNQLSIDDPSISKYHASISIGPDGTMSIADTGSTNGTFINGQRIAYGKSVAFDNDDIIKFGGVEVTFRMVTADVVKPNESELSSDNPLSSTMHLSSEIRTDEDAPPLNTHHPKSISPVTKDPGKEVR